MWGGALRPGRPAPSRFDGWDPGTIDAVALRGFHSFERSQSPRGGARKGVVDGGLHELRLPEPVRLQVLRAMRLTAARG